MYHKNANHKTKCQFKAIQTFNCCVFRPAFGCCWHPKAGGNMIIVTNFPKINKSWKTEKNFNFIKTDTFPLFTRHIVAGQPFNIPLMYSPVLWNKFLKRKKKFVNNDKSACYLHLHTLVLNGFCICNKNVDVRLVSYQTIYNAYRIHRIM